MVDWRPLSQGLPEPPEWWWRHWPASDRAEYEPWWLVALWDVPVFTAPLAILWVLMGVFG